MIRRWTLYLVLGAFLTGPALCLIIDLNDIHYGPWSTTTLTYAADACGTSGVVHKGPSDSSRPLVSSLLGLEQDSFYKGVQLRPPFPPPRS